MPGLDKTMGAIPGGGTRRVYGKAHWDGDRWYAQVGDNLLSCRWAGSVKPWPGMNLIIDITDDGRGQSSAMVMDSYTDQPKPLTGTATQVTAAGAGTVIKFTGTDGVVYETNQFIGEYSTGDPVYLSWDSGKPTIIGKIGAIDLPSQQPAPLAGTPVTMGSETLTATHSNSYGWGGWGQIGMSKNGGEALYTGTWSNQPVTASWFYGSPKPVLQGKRITRIRFRLPQENMRRDTSTVAIHLHAHTSSSRPDGDVTRVAGPHDVTIASMSNASWHDLPLTFATALQNGGGISIAGNPNAMFWGRLDDPESGKLIIDWQA